MAALAAQPDEDWQDFNEFTAASENTPEPVTSDTERAVCGACGERSSSSGACGERKGARSEQEDLLQGFQQKLSLCFSTNCTDPENISDIKPITEEDLLRQDE